MAILLRQQHMLIWPASAMLTGNGVAFVLRVPGTEHGDWWSLRGWWIFAATAVGGLLSKHLLKVRGVHIFNPSNIGLVVCFLALGPGRADPLDFWWGPMSPALALALELIVVGGFLILSRLHLLVMAVAFWLTFVAALGVIAATGHSMSARWHHGPVEGLHFWIVLATSPEILVVLFFMLTDPKTVPVGRRGRLAFAVAVALLAALLVAPARTEFWAKVAVLGALAIVCAARPGLAVLAPRIRPSRRTVLRVRVAGLAAYVGALVGGGQRAEPAVAIPARTTTTLPPVVIGPSRGVDGTLDRKTANQIAADVVGQLRTRWGSAPRLRRITVWLEAGEGQAAIAVARVEGLRVETLELSQSRSGYTIARSRA